MTTPEQFEELMNATNDIPLFSLDGRIFDAKIVDVYDGDTFKACFFLDGKIVKYNCRAYGYDCAEMRPRHNLENREIEKQHAKEAKQYFINQISKSKTGLVKLHALHFDKYGRLLANVYVNDDINDINVNKVMVDDGYGKPYYGGHKE